MGILKSITKMKVIYSGNNHDLVDDIKSSEENFILLHKNRWNDYGYETTFNTTCEINGKRIEFPSVQILIEDIYTSYEFFDDLLDKGEWNGIFPIPNTNYISNPSGIEFYELIAGKLSMDTAVDVSGKLRDSSYLIRTQEDPAAISLVKSQGFTESLLRGSGSNKAFVDGWRVFLNGSAIIDDFSLITDIGHDRHIEVGFNFSEPLLPNDINVLIGPNGSGKSQSLLKLVKAWLKSNNEKGDVDEFSVRPNISQVIVVSYSPFELFPVDTNGYKNIKDTNIYKYFGFRKRRNSPRKDRPAKIHVTREHPKRNAAKSLVSCAEDDLKYGSIKDWGNKVSTAYKVLHSALDFDYLALRIDKKIRKDVLFDNESHAENYIIEVNEERYFGIAPGNQVELDFEKLLDHCIDDDGIVFIKNNRVLELSSGQRLFSYIVINILGALKRNSLVIVDEPELFLHPTLEIAFVGMLKKILDAFSSKAILATHSLVTVREVPRSCVHVFSEEKNALYINHPPFETFSGDMQRISSYVFGDKSVSKPYEDWMRTKLTEYGNADSLIEALGEHINEEMIIQLHAMERGEW